MFFPTLLNSEFSLKISESVSSLKSVSSSMLEVSFFIIVCNAAAIISKELSFIRIK